MNIAISIAGSTTSSTATNVSR